MVMRLRWKPGNRSLPQCSNFTYISFNLLAQLLIHGHVQYEDKMHVKMSVAQNLTALSPTTYAS